MDNKLRLFNWKPDVPDFRDYYYKPTITELPKSVDLRHFCSSIEDQGNLGSCHDDKTEILTERGWILFSDLNDDLVASVNLNDNTIEFVATKRVIKLQYNGELHSIDGRSLNFSVTPDHKMVVRKWDESQKTLGKEYNMVKMKNIGFYSGLLTNCNTKSEEIESIEILGTENKIKEKTKSFSISMNSWLRFLGIYLAEGTLLKEFGQYKIQIAAVKERERDFVKKTLEEIGVSKPCILKDRFTFCHKRIYSMLENYGLKGIKAPFKFVPQFVFQLGSENIRNLLLGHFMGDGCEQNGLKSHYTSSKRLADDLHRLIILSGQWGTLSSRPPRQNGIINGRRISGKFPEYRISVWNKDSLSLERDMIEKINYNGFVYCAEVEPYHTLITRREGKVLISGNCTGNAIVGCLEYLENKTGQFMDKSEFTDLSRLFVYYNERWIEGTIKEDSGAYIRDGIKSLVKWGVCEESLYPYDEPKFENKPSLDCYTDAVERKITSYARVNVDLNDIKSCLMEGNPIIFGMTVYNDMMSDDVAKTGMIPMPSKSDKSQGGHCVLMVGYDDSKECVIVRNSWGADWGISGYFELPYEYITNEDLVEDLWMISK